MTQWVARSHLGALAATTVLLGLGACGSPVMRERQERSVVAKAMYDEYCKKAGVKIHRRAENVDGVLLMKLRPRPTDTQNQFVFDDPYGIDSSGMGYILTMLRGGYQHSTSGEPTVKPPPRMGFQFVEAVDPADGIRYRYTGRLEEPWLTNKSYLKGYIRFVVDKAPAPGTAPRYGVTYDDISTRKDRDYWIAGSSLRVIDVQTNEVMAERIGYMYDPAQGANSGGRSPWLHAMDHACPSYYERYPGLRPSGGRAATITYFQTLDFVESVLQPAP